MTIYFDYAETTSCFIFQTHGLHLHQISSVPSSDSDHQLIYRLADFWIAIMHSFGLSGASARYLKCFCFNCVYYEYWQPIPLVLSGRILNCLWKRFAACYQPLLTSAETSSCRKNSFLSYSCLESEILSI